MRFFLYSSAFLYLLSFIAVLACHLSGRGGRGERGGAVGAATLSRRFLTAGLLLHTVALGLRIYSTGHAPMASMYETLVFYSWTVALISLIIIFRYGERFTELITVPASILALFFSFTMESAGRPLTLILRTRWFETHVTFSFVAYAFFTLAFAAAVLYLIYDFMGGEAEGEGDGAKAREDKREAMRKFQDIAGRSVLWGFFFFSASMFAGAIWGYLAWGAYWMWEPKIIWSFIVWFYYAGAMHAYYVKDWRGRGLSIATVFGFFVVLFTYLGVSLLMKSSHSF